MPIEISGTTVIDDSRNIVNVNNFGNSDTVYTCLLYTSPSPRDATLSRMPSSA